MTPAAILLSAVTMERLGELFLARRNTTALMARGAFEIASGHYPLIVLLHTAWLLGLWLIGSAQLVSWMGFVFLTLQILRGWILWTLGRRWTTRIIVLPGEPLIKSGPYRFLAHPNYLVVIGEIAVVPLSLGLFWYALIFSLANAAILAVRIRAENAALAELRGTEISRGTTPTLWQGLLMTFRIACDSK